MRQFLNEPYILRVRPRLNFNNSDKILTIKNKSLILCSDAFQVFINIYYYNLMFGTLMALKQMINILIQRYN